MDGGWWRRVVVAWVSWWGAGCVNGDCGWDVKT